MRNFSKCLSIADFKGNTIKAAPVADEYLILIWIRPHPTGVPVLSS